MGMTTLQKMMAKTVDYYLSNGGADVARAEIRSLAPTFSFMDDWPQAFRWAMASIDAFEKAERIRAIERERELQQERIDTMTVTKPDLTDDHICRCLERLMDEEWESGELLFNQQSHWQAVFRIMSDAGLFADDDFDGFDSWVKRVIPSELRRLYSKQSVKNISQTLFCKPLRQWKYDPTLMKKREPFDRMKQIAERFGQLLNERE